MEDRSVTTDAQHRVLADLVRGGGWHSVHKWHWGTLRALWRRGYVEVRQDTTYSRLVRVTEIGRALAARSGPQEG